MARGSVTSLNRIGVELATRQVVPIVSKDSIEARKSVLEVYKQLQRKAPEYWWDCELRGFPLTTFRDTLKNEFLKNSHITDVRIIDRLVYGCWRHINEFHLNIYNKDHILNYLFRENVEPKPNDFLSRFFAGKD